MKNAKLLRSFWTLGVIASLGMVFCSCSSRDEAAPEEPTTWDYSFTADGIYVRASTPPPADNQSANTTIGLRGVPALVTRVSNKSVQETLPVSDMPYHINQHIQLTGGRPNISLTYAGATCPIVVAGARRVWKVASNEESGIEFDVWAADAGACPFIGEIAQSSAANAKAAAKDSSGGTIGAAVNGISDGASDLPVITETQLKDDFQDITFSSLGVGTYIAFVINNYTIWNNLANVNANAAAHPGTTFPGTSDTYSFSHGGFSGEFYYLDCTYNGSCDQVNEPAAQAYPFIVQLNSTDDRGGDTRIQVDDWDIYDNNGTLAATIGLNWDPWDTTNCPVTGSVHGETYCSITNVINGTDGYFTCTGQNGYNCDLSMYSASYAGQADSAGVDILHDYELAMETLATVLSDDPTGVIIAALVDIILAIYDYFDVHAYGTILVTLTYDVPCNLPSGMNCGYPFGIGYPACSFGCGDGQECSYTSGTYVGTCETCTPDCSFSNSCGYSDGCSGTCTGCADGSACEPNTETGYGHVCASALSCSGQIGNWGSSCNINSCSYNANGEFCATCTGGAPNSGTPVKSCDVCAVYDYNSCEGSPPPICLPGAGCHGGCTPGLTCD